MKKLLGVIALVLLLLPVSVIAKVVKKPVGAKLPVSYMPVEQPVQKPIGIFNGEILPVTPIVIGDRVEITQPGPIVSKPPVVIKPPVVPPTLPPIVIDRPTWPPIPDSIKIPTYNTSYGVNGLVANTIGIQNTAIGYDSLKVNTTGNNNTAIGATSMRSNTSGSYNTAVGFNTLVANTTGTFNSAFGETALRDNTTGNNNTALGPYSLTYNTTGNMNTGAGVGALDQNTTGSYNAGFGYSSLGRNRTGDHNTGVGHSAGFNNISGSYNTSVGEFAMGTNTASSASSCLGYKCLFNSTGANNTAIGYQAGDNITTGSNNIIIGHDVDAPAADSVQKLNIGNTVYGDLAKDYIGIGESAPTVALDVNGSAILNGGLTVAEMITATGVNVNGHISSESVKTMSANVIGNLSANGANLATVNVSKTLTSPSVVTQKLTASAARVDNLAVKRGVTADTVSADNIAAKNTVTESLEVTGPMTVGAVSLKATGQKVLVSRPEWVCVRYPCVNNSPYAGEVSLEMLAVVTTLKPVQNTFGIITPMPIYLPIYDDPYLNLPLSATKKGNIDQHVAATDSTNIETLSSADAAVTNEGEITAELVMDDTTVTVNNGQLNLGNSEDLVSSLDSQEFDSSQLIQGKLMSQIRSFTKTINVSVNLPDLAVEEFNFDAVHAVTKSNAARIFYIKLGKLNSYEPVNYKLTFQSKIDRPTDIPCRDQFGMMIVCDPELHQFVGSKSASSGQVIQLMYLDGEWSIL